MLLGKHFCTPLPGTPVGQGTYTSQMLRTVLEMTEGEEAVLGFLSDEDQGRLSSVRESERVILLALLLG